MAKLKITNNAVSRLSANISATDTSISLLPGGGAAFPSLAADEWFPATMVKVDGTLEIVSVIARATDVLTIVRGQESTAAISFNAGDRLELRMTAGSIMGEMGRIEEISSELRSDLSSVSGGSIVGLDDGESGTLWTSVSGFVSRVLSSLGASFVGFIQDGIGAVKRSVQDELRDHVSVKQFGAKGDGSDDTEAIKKALLKGRRVYFPAPSVSYYVTQDLLMKPGQMVYGDGNSTLIELIDGSINGFLTPLGAVGCIVRDMLITTRNKTNATPYKAAVNIVESSFCKVENVTVSAMGYHGVRMGDSNYNQVIGCRFSAFFGAVQDQADIAILNNSSYNYVQGNYCYGGGDHGVLIQDTYAGSTPTGNTIIGNHIGASKGNGVLVYVTHAYDTQTIISGNRVSGIKGTALGGLSGAGIYIQSAGGTTITGNIISDCCQQTTDFSTQAVGHISVAIGKYGSGQHAPVIVSNNHINAPRGPGIWCATSAAPVLVGDNTILISSIGPTDEGRGIYAVNCDGVKISKNTVTQSNPNFQSIQVLASSDNVSGASISDNWVKTVAYGISVSKSGSGTVTNATVNGNRVYNGNQTAMSLLNITGLTCVGNDVESTGIALNFSDCSASRFSGNQFRSTLGSYSIIFTGTTGSNNIVDESNLLGGIVENDSTSGTLISQYGATAPALSGLWANGDRVISRQPTVGSPKGWRCTSAGNPGTWISEGNL